MKTESLLKLLSITLKLPIMLFDNELNLKKALFSNFDLPFIYDFKLMIENIEKENSVKFHFYSGNFNESFLVYKYENFYILFGPFRCSIINKEDLYKKFEDFSIRKIEQEQIYNFLNTLTFFTLTDCKSIVSLIHYVFTGIIEDLFYDSVYNHFSIIKNKINQKKIDSLMNQTYLSNDSLMFFEKRILNFIKQDISSSHTLDLSSLLSSLPSFMLTGDSLRSEKNYSIVLFEKFSNASLEFGLDLTTIIESRNMFIKETEKTKTLNDCLIVRESGIMYYLDKIKKLKTENYPYLIKHVINYINTNLYRNITTKEISEHFNISISGLCFLFKKEVKMTIKNYVLEQKICVAKRMLKNSYSISEIALALGFSDSSHFSRSFKKLTGRSPKDFKQAN